MSHRWYCTQNTFWINAVVIIHVMDTDDFNRLHLWAPENAPALYEKQLRAGVKLDDNHYLRRFPTWFSIFNGNEAILLSTGKAAAVCGKLLGDKQLLDMGCGQLYWTVVHDLGKM